MQSELKGLSNFFYDLSKIFIAGAVANGIFSVIKISDVLMLFFAFIAFIVGYFFSTMK